MLISDSQGGKLAWQPGEAGTSLIFWRKKNYCEQFWFKVSFHEFFWEAAEQSSCSGTTGGHSTQKSTPCPTTILQSAAFLEFIVWPEMRLLIDSVLDES